MDAQEYAKDFLEGVRSEAAATGEGKCAVSVSYTHLDVYKRQLLH